LEIDKPFEIKPGELRCPRCFGRDIVPSMPRGVGDAVMRRMGRIPRHCRSCGKRFYASLERLAAAAAREVG
jgi:transcriptional regulator NrdR family protein